MIVSNIIGGLGNQMFQYAAGRALSLAKGALFSLDISDFTNYRLHQGFELQRVFDCPLQIASEVDIRNILGWQSSPIVRRTLMHPRLSFFRRQGLVVEPHFHYWREVSNVPVDSYLTGYWQSERYFRNAAQTIRSSFIFKPPLNQRNAELVKQIERVNAISLHVRRGDYVKNPKTTAIHGVCPLEYYRSAIRYVAERVENSSFFIFSDDTAWVKENLKIDFPLQYVDHNQGSESYNDMRLMSLCRHHIIANSSFSWWGAWLNPRPDKIVLAPRKWFANNNDVTDLFPQGWVVL
jgi:hypothetical protein